MTLKEHIIGVINAGLEVHNDRGGYVCNIGGISGRNWVHQTCCRSTDCYDNPDDAVTAFLRESGNEEG